MDVAHAPGRKSYDVDASLPGRQTVTQILPVDECGQDVFGLHLSHLEPAQIAEMLIHERRAPGSGAGVVATANIQHIATMRTNRDFRTAMVEAEVVTCDGFPVYMYAKHRGYQIERRTTGREITAVLMESDLPKDHKLFFVVDGDVTAAGLYQWAVAKGISDRVAVTVPPMGFVHNDLYCAELSKQIKAFGATLLFLCTGAPQSEIYAHRYKSMLPDCWALCVGQSAKLVLGMTPQPPEMLEKLNLEWLWRIGLEPRRMLKRYVPSAMGFLAAVLDDTRKRQSPNC